MEKFTKGPWKIDEYGNILPEGARDSFSCIRAGGLSLASNNGEPMYNRYLIAAAPEMYAMLKAIASGALVATYEINELLAKSRGEK